MKIFRSGEKIFLHRPEGRVWRNKGLTRLNAPTQVKGSTKVVLVNLVVNLVVFLVVDLEAPSDLTDPLAPWRLAPWPPGGWVSQVRLVGLVGSGWVDWPPGPLAVGSVGSVGLGWVRLVGSGRLGRVGLSRSGWLRVYGLKG